MRQLVGAGCRLVQLRCKGWTPEALAVEARAALGFTRAAGALLVVNDHPEVARDVGADGVHVGQLDADARAVRAVVGDAMIIGVSHNTPEELRASLDLGEADYVAVGPVHGTPHLSHDKPVRGLAWVREARSMTPLPLVAIGGITPALVPRVREAGADAWAVIRGVADARSVAAYLDAARPERP